VLTVVALMYFIPCYALSLVAQWLEKGPEQRAQRDREIAGMASPGAVAPETGGG
jgi:hypothetical protein